eukprot:COSAG06_NODE_10762_length_1621_cov_2.371222_2_plen_254_part_00
MAAGEGDGTALSVCYISMLCEEGSSEHRVCSLHPEGADDAQWLARTLGTSSVRLTTLSISNGAALPDASQFDAIVLGGTFHGVYEGRPWQLPLRGWLEAHRKTGKPLLGICGGHQAMAVATGGTVARRPGGPQVGSIAVDVTAAGAEHPLLGALATAEVTLRLATLRQIQPADCPSCISARSALLLHHAAGTHVLRRAACCCSVAAGLGDAPAFHFGNSDEVSVVPACATVLARTADSPATAIDYGGEENASF